MNPQSWTDPKPFQDIKVIGLIADMAACGHYRLEYPFQMLRELGAMADTASGFDLQLLHEYDIIIAQRQYDPKVYKALREAQSFKKVLLYEVDDFLHGVHPFSPAYQTFRPGNENLQVMDDYLQTSDGLLVTTPELASCYNRAKRTWVIPNSLDFGIRDWENKEARNTQLAGRTVIGWAGSSFHPDDMLPLQSSLKAVLKNHPEAVFAIASGPAQVRQFLQPLDLPQDQVVILSPVPFQDYPQLLSQFDIGIAPLSNNLFNRCKSELKLLEYGAWGIPYVAAKVAPYQRFHQSSGGKGGLLAVNSNDWEAGLSRMLDDIDFRLDASDFMREHVREHYDLKKNTYLWASALRQARDMTRNQTQVVQAYTQRHKPGRNDSCPCGSGAKYKRCCLPAYG